MTIGTASSISVHEDKTIKEKYRRNRLSIGGWLVRILFACLFAFPLIFMVVSSFKPDDEIMADLSSVKAFLPTGNVSLDNYAQVFTRVPAGRFLLNSVFITLVTVVLGVLVNSMAAFAIQRLNIRFKKIIFTFILATLMVPFETYAIPLLWWINQLPRPAIDQFGLYFTRGWMDTLTIQIIPFIANAFSVYLYMQYFETIPKDLDEAAKVDGAGWFRIYSRIVMPLSGPATATVVILSFLPMWNQYLWPLMVVQSENNRPVMIGVQYFQQMTTSWGQIMAYSSLITLPIIAVFVIFQRQFVSSIAATGVKG
ncbi:MAG: carbohydrate ABC transporter permease [Bifidobacteriales bacterium]|uniref:Carbohydrate ABC transporter permease n=1 Tax=Bifidobacterium asteroides TaxID=1684 RepID=A0ABS3IU10_9BIFI|nr:carbohydrate ABC transporter permease [Bifidobacterium polysaccharolyticum]MBI0063866.1 carbohydrate ABC transporter permease [Bifidobacterium polysaccharolyticum]MCT6837354.1 carbohydrate ABC transporter permease [Bifidobacteriales bacterium]